MRIITALLTGTLSVLLVSGCAPGADTNEKRYSQNDIEAIVAEASAKTRAEIQNETAPASLPIATKPAADTPCQTKGGTQEGNRCGSPMTVVKKKAPVKRAPTLAELDAQDSAIIRSDTATDEEKTAAAIRVEGRRADCEYNHAC